MLLKIQKKPAFAWVWYEKNSFFFIKKKKKSKKYNFKNKFSIFFLIFKLLYNPTIDHLEFCYLSIYLFSFIHLEIFSYFRILIMSVIRDQFILFYSFKIVTNVHMLYWVLIYYLNILV